MEMITKKNIARARRLFAVVIFFGMSATSSAPAAANDSEPIYLSGETYSNTKFFTGNKPLAYGLRFFADDSLIEHADGIFLTGSGSIGIRIDGADNRFLISPNGYIQVRGTGGKGLWFSYGQGNRLNIAGNIFSAGNALEFGSTNAADRATIDDFTLTGTLTGKDHAILIRSNAAVSDINIDDGAKISGNIASNSATATNFNVKTNFDYDGDITGAFNLNIKSGTLNFSGAANISGVNVSKSGKLFGGTFTMENFVSHGTIGASSRDTNLIINGNLTSDGILRHLSGGTGGKIIVSGTANVDGSTVTTDSLLPNETATVLVANSVTGKIVNDEKNPVPISAMLNATGKIVGNTLTVTTHEADNLHGLDSKETETFHAMKKMYDDLDAARQEKMRDFYNLSPAEAKNTLEQIGSTDAAQIMSVAQQSTAVDRFIADRITRIFAPDYVDINVRPMKFSDDAAETEVPVRVKVPKRGEESFWLNYMKNWGSLRGGTDYHGSVIVGGYDRPFGEKWRAGFFATYGTIGYGADSSRAKVYDTRVGLYAGYHNRQSDVYLYINGGQLRNSLHRSLSSLGLQTNANYKSRIIEIGGEYKYDLQPRRIWHVSPFVNFQTSHLKQNGYDERGAGVYNQHVDANSNAYFAAQAGLDFKRYYRDGMIGFRFGVKHGFTGADPELHFSYEGDGTRNYRLRQKRDKTHFVCSLRGENEFARGWFIGGETEFQLGKHDKDLTASVILRRTW